MAVSFSFAIPDFVTGPVNAMLAWFTPAAPDIGYPGTFTVPEGAVYDPLEAARRGAYQTEPVNDPQGYANSWKFVAPPGVGDAPQHVFSTFTLIPLDNNGPGDVPLSYLRFFYPQNYQPFAARWNGFPIAGGTLQLRGLSEADPMESMTSSIYGEGAQ